METNSLCAHTTATWLELVWDQAPKTHHESPGMSQYKEVTLVFPPEVLSDQLEP